MNLNSYLEKIANAAIVRDEEKIGIKNSINTLEHRLTSSFGKEIKENFVFGSYSRDTILPRDMDENSDVDYIVVFKNDGDESKIYTPQTYLNWLKNFAESRYASSEIYQSTPTIILSLNHIRIELVPAISSIFSLGYKIPGKDYSSWISTDPKRFNEILTVTNKQHNNLIRKLIRILKYWNVKNDSPFESYELEQQVCSYDFRGPLLKGGNLKDYFIEFIQNFNLPLLTTFKKLEAIKKAQAFIIEMQILEDQENQRSPFKVTFSKDINPSAKTSVDVIKKLLPAPLSLQLELMKNRAF